MNDGDAVATAKELPQIITLSESQRVSLRSLIEDIAVLNDEINVRAAKVNGKKRSYAAILSEIATASNLELSFLDSYRFDGNELVRI